MADNVVRLRSAAQPLARGADLAEAGREYVLDMVEQLAVVARASGDARLGAQLEGLLKLQRQGRGRGAGSRSS